MIGLCTDSNAQLPAELVQRYDVEVVPLIVVVDGVEHGEGPEFGADRFFELLDREPPPTVTTAAPSPGAFVAAYERLVAAGADEILSVHVGSAISGTFNAARLAAGGASVPVRLVDTGVASFAVGCSVWAAGDAIAAGGTLEAAAAAAASVAARCGNVFVVDDLRSARQGGRLGSSVRSSLTVLTMEGGRMEATASFEDVEGAAAAMAARIVDEGGGRRLRIGIGHSDAASDTVASALAVLLAEDPVEHDLVRYRVGPSVAAHTGGGTAGAVFHSLEP
jgi:DegV family protein with EDD domain